MNRHSMFARAAAFISAASSSVAQTATQVFVEDFAVMNLPGISDAQQKSLGQALASEVQLIVARNASYLPMTFENLESQLRKEKRAEDLACSRRDQKCIMRILDNYGCTERLFGTVRTVVNKTQVSLSWFRGDNLVPGGTALEYSDSNPEAISEAARRIAAKLFNAMYEAPRPVAADNRGYQGQKEGAGSGAYPHDTVVSVLCEEEILIPAGPFKMGSDRGENCERPVHSDNLPAFFLDKYEVTHAQCARFVQPTNRAPPSCRWDPKGTPNTPVTCVSWWDAREYCDWAGRRLPTEAEWEKAASGTDHRIFPWGDEPASCKRAVMNSGSPGCGSGFAMPVGSRMSGAGPYGHLDLSGNAAEWVNDLYAVDYYDMSPPDNPQGPSMGKLRVVRGGNWADNLALYLRSSARARKNPMEFNEYNGFRCAPTKR